MSSKTCTECHANKPIEDFALRVRNIQAGKAGERTASCQACVEKAKKRRKERKRKMEAEVDGEGADEGHAGDIEEPVRRAISLADFVNIVRQSETPMQVQARVDVVAAAPLELPPRERAARVAKVLGEFTNLHWT